MKSINRIIDSIQSNNSIHTIILSYILNIDKLCLSFHVSMHILTFLVRAFLWLVLRDIHLRLCLFLLFCYLSLEFHQLIIKLVFINIQIVILIHHVIHVIRLEFHIEHFILEVCHFVNIYFCHMRFLFF